MARTVTYVPLQASPSELAIVPLDQIPADVRQEVEEMYAGLQKAPNGRFTAVFDTAEEAATYTSQVVSYCKQRPAGAIRFRKSPVRGAADNELHFRISDLKDDAGDAADAGNAADVKASVGKSTKATKSVK